MIACTIVVENCSDMYVELLSALKLVLFQNRLNTSNISF